MKKIITSLLFAALFFFPSLSHGQYTLTINDGTVKSPAAPLDFYHTDYNYCRSQFIIPSSAIENMSGEVIKSMTFYSANTSDNRDKPNLKVRVRITVLGSGDNPYFSPTNPTWNTVSGRTTVHMAGVKTVEGLLTLTFDVGFYYPGGNLLFDIENVTSGNTLWLGSSDGFYGVNGTQTNPTTIYGQVSNSSASYPATITDIQSSYFKPKITFTYESHNADDYSNCYNEGYSYNCSFENQDDRAGWFSGNYNPTNNKHPKNVWRIGDSLSNGVGSYALYISPWYRGNNTVASGEACWNFACTYVKLGANMDYAFDYDWHCGGTDNFIRAALIPWTESNLTEIRNNNTSSWLASTLPAGAIALDGGSSLNGHPTWQHFSGSFTNTSNREWILVFFWKGNSSTSTNPPAAIDNIRIVPIHTVPYTCDFENDEINNGWDSEYNSVCNTYWLINNDASHSGNNSLLIYNSGYNYYVEESCKQYAYTAIDFTAGDYQVKYFWQCVGELNYDYGRAALVPVDVPFTANEDFPTDDGIIYIDGGNYLQTEELSWQEMNVVVTVPTGSYYLVFYWKNDDSFSDGAPLAIDDISITPYQAPATYTITATANDPSMGTVTGGGSNFTAGATVTLTATPKEGYHFVNWNDGNTDNPRQITVTGNANYIANFAVGSGTNGIDDVLAGGMRLYPNPATNQVTIAFEGGKALVELVDLNGSIVMSQSVEGGETTLNLSNVATGVYFVRLVSNNHTSVQKLMVK
ncbi:MAG: T9SS type A sorting domain-containing protein [Bacteroidales bacterium]|nr:T9SS type A sorting domain-containing protein [Bacteroidales bacterium]